MFHDFVVGADPRTTRRPGAGRDDDATSWAPSPGPASPPDAGGLADRARGAAGSATTVTTAERRAEAASEAATAATDTAASPPPGFDPPDSQADRHLLDLGAGVLATGAFVSPGPWLAIVGAAVAAGVVVRGVLDHGLSPGVVARGVRARAHPRSLGRLAGLVAGGAVLAVLVPAVVCAVVWAVRYGSDGTAAAARVGVWAHTPRFAVVLACYVLVAGTGAARERRIGHVRQMTGQVSGSAVAALTLGAVVVAGFVATVVPRSEPGGRGGDGVGWLPPSLHGQADRLRTVVVETEASAVGGCLTQGQHLHWHALHPRGSDEVSLVLLDGEPGQGDVITAAVALHNQLAPWVATIEIATADRSLLVLERDTLPSAVPVEGPAALREAATTGRALVEDDAAAFDRSLALDCSVSPVL